jgi:hypothetical protein
MKFTAQNSMDSTNFLIDPHALNVHDRLNTKSTKNNQGISPKIIAEQVSNHLMDLVRKQFNTVKEDFDAKELKK